MKNINETQTYFIVWPKKRLQGFMERPLLLISKKESEILRMNSNILEHLRDNMSSFPHTLIVCVLAHDHIDVVQ